MLGTFSGFSPRAASRTTFVTSSHSLPCSVPTTRQPYGSNQSRGPPWTTLDTAFTSMPKSFQSRRNTRFERPRPQAELRVSWLAPGVSPPSPSTAKTFTSSAPAILSATAWPTVGGMP